MTHPAQDNPYTADEIHDLPDLCISQADSLQMTAQVYESNALGDAVNLLSFPSARIFRIANALPIESGEIYAAAFEAEAHRIAQLDTAHETLTILKEWFSVTPHKDTKSAACVALAYLETSMGLNPHA